MNFFRGDAAENFNSDRYVQNENDEKTLQKSSPRCGGCASDSIDIVLYKYLASKDNVKIV